jgi:hypothetical protein
MEYLLYILFMEMRIVFDFRVFFFVNPACTLAIQPAQDKYIWNRIIDSSAQEKAAGGTLSK